MPFSSKPTSSMQKAFINSRNELGPEPHKDINGKALCIISGAMNIFSEMAAYFYLFSYSYVMKRKITSLTSGIQK